MEIELTGHSDDMIVVEGDLHSRLLPEFSHDPTVVAVSDGTLLEADFGENGWVIEPVIEGRCDVEK